MLIPPCPVRSEIRRLWDAGHDTAEIAARVMRREAIVARSVAAYVSEKAAATRPEYRRLALDAANDQAAREPA